MRARRATVVGSSSFGISLASEAEPMAAAAAVAAAIADATAERCLFASRLSFRSSRRSAEFHRFLI